MQAVVLYGTIQIQIIRAKNDYCILSHCEPLTKEGLLCYLESVL